jgi:small subunit ribosomal protein S2
MTNIGLGSLGNLSMKQMPRAGQSGQKKRLEATRKGGITWLPPPGLGKPEIEDEKTTVTAVMPTQPKIEIAEEKEHTRGTRSRKRDIDLEEDDDL